MFGMMPGWGGGVVPNNALLLCHFDGSNGSTSFPDDSTFARTVTAVGTAQLSTAVKKWGSASLYLPNSSAGVSVPHDAAFAFANGGTVEWWANPQDFVGAEKQHVSKWSNAGGYQWAAGHIGSTGQAYFYVNEGTNFYFWQSAGGAVVNNNTFKHFAAQVTKLSSSLYLYQLWVDGSRVLRNTLGVPITSGTTALKVGIDGDSSSGHQLYLDDLSILPAPKYGDVSTIDVPTGPFTP